MYFHLDPFTAVLLDVSVRSLVLLAALYLLAHALRPASAATRALTWKLAFTGLAMLPVVCLLAPPFPIRLPRPAAVASPVLVGGANSAPWAARRPGAASSESATEGRPPAPQPHTAGDASRSSSTPLIAAAVSRRQHVPFGAARLPVSVLISTVWAVIALILLARSLFRLIALSGLTARTVSASGQLRAIADEAARESGVCRPVAIRIGASDPAATSPMTWGLVRPVLVLPAGADSWPEERLRAVLLHEMAHISRADWAARVGADLLCALYWPNPLVRLAARRLSHETEMACDDRVLASGMDAAEYAAHLLEIVRMRKLTDPRTCAIAMADRSHLELRMRSVLDPKRRHGRTSSVPRAALAAALALCVTAIGAARLTAATSAARSRSGSPVATAEASQPEPVLPAGSALSEMARSEPRGAPAVGRAQIPEERRPRHDNIAWGRAVRGLQVGIERQDGAGVAAFGHEIVLRLWVHNESKRPIRVTFPSARPMAEPSTHFWRVETRNGTEIRIQPEPAALGEAAGGEVELAAGADHPLLMPDVRFTLQERQGGAATAPIAIVRPTRCTVQLFPFTSPTRDHGWMRPLGSGKIDIDVAADAGKLEGAPDHTAKTPAAPADTLADVSWGKAADGLQAGMRIVGRRKRFVPGERVMLDCFVRNVTDANISLNYAVRVYLDDLPIVQKGTNPPVQQSIKGVFLTGLDPAFELTLPAHAAILIEHQGFVLGDKPLPLPQPSRVPKGLEQYPYLVDPALGEYTVQQPITYHIETEAEVKRLFARSHSADRVIIEPFNVTLIGADGKRTTTEATVIPVSPDRSPLLTGTVPFTIMGGADGAGQAAAAAPAVDPNIAWGPAVGGLQAGLRAPGGRTRYPLGCKFQTKMMGIST